MRVVICLIAFSLICGAFAQTNTTFCFANGCSFSDSTDGRLTIGESNNEYDYACIRVAPNATVSFTMDFDFHPLVAGYVNDRNEGVPTPGSDINDSPTGDTTAQFVVSSWAAIPFYCNNHYLTGMKGVIYVGSACESVVAPVAAPVASPVAAPVATPTTSATPSSAPVATPAKKSSASSATVGAVALIAGLVMF